MKTQPVDSLYINELAGLRRNKPRSVIDGLDPSLAAKIKSVRIDGSRMTLGKIIGKGKCFILLPEKTVHIASNSFMCLWEFLGSS